MSITIAQINEIAFITPVEPPAINEELITAVVNGPLYDVLGDTLHGIYIQYPTFFADIENEILNPFIAYNVKYLVLQHINSEATEVNNNFTTSLQIVLSIARDYKTILQDYIFSKYGILPSSINGFKIPETVITLNEKDMTLIVDPGNSTDYPPFIHTVPDVGTTVFNLPYDLKNSSLVFINNAIINPVNYSGIRTNSIVFTKALDKYDKLVVTF